MVSAVDDMASGDKIPIEGTESLERIGFYHVIGGYFPRRLWIGAWDYPGEELNSLARQVEDELTPSERLRIFYLDVRTLLFSGKSRSKRERFFHEVRNSDLALLLVDVEKVINDGKDPKIKDLRKVGRRVQENDGEVLVVATKVDLILEDILNPEMDPEEVGIFADVPGAKSFREEVTDYLTDEMTQIDILLGDLDAEVIHPVYYEYENRMVDGESKYRPVLDQHNRLQPVGHDHLAEEIETRL